MTDKQIMIDGVDVSGCVCFATAQAIATNTGLIIKDIDNACTPKQQPCQDIKNCMFKKLTKQLKDAEKTVEECHKYQAKLEDEIERLEEENKLFRQAHKTEQDRRRNLERVLDEIKEIAEKYNNTHLGEQQYCCKDILQKISEVTND